jgi:acyl-CoA synthetase (NDP forming)
MVLRSEQTRSAIDSVLRPKSVVVIGASPRGRGFTSAPLKNLKRHRFPGAVYAVNPNYDDIDGVLCRPDVASLPEAPDTAVIVVGARRAPGALAECAAAGVRSATIIAGGFAELGDDGARLEAQIRTTLATTGIRLVGPNTAGLMNVADDYVPRAGLNHPEPARRGALAIATQSGALCNTLLNRVFAYGHGLTYAVATGSQWDLDLWDFVDYYIADERTRAILTITEGLKDAEKFLTTARRAAAAGKPIILLKPGRSELGTAAVQTHSGALAGAADVQLSLTRENGVIVVDELDELWETGQLFERWSAPVVPPARPWRLGISTYSGGDGVLAADAAELAGLHCPPPSPATREALAATFDLATPGNPFDYTGEVVDKPELIGPATRALLDDPSFDIFLVAAPVWSAHFAKWILGPAVDEAAARPGQLAAVSLWSAGEVTAEAEELALSSGLPLFDGSHRAVRAMGRYASFHAESHRWADEPSPASAPGQPEGRVTAVLDYWASRAVLSAAGIAFNEAELVSDPQGAAEAAERLGHPVTMKVSSNLVVHKAAAGAVRLYLNDGASVRTAAAEMLSRFPDARLIVEAYTPSVAMALVGGHRDPEFGPIIVTGLGGGYAEAYHDVAHVRCPAGPSVARRALLATTFGRMLGDGSERLTQLSAAVAHASRWFAAHPEVDSFDINPVLLGLDGAMVAVDARVETSA